MGRGRWLTPFFTQQAFTGYLPRVRSIEVASAPVPLEVLQAADTKTGFPGGRAYERAKRKKQEQGAGASVQSTVPVSRL